MNDAIVKTAEEIIGRTRRLSDVSRLIIAIDGRCAAGKTTLAECLRERAGWSVFHMDDFFLRPEQRTEERLKTPGGNVDHERFLEEVLIPLKNGADRISYRAFDCRIGTLTDPIVKDAGRVCVVEGSYSCHPNLWEHYDLRIFLTVDPDEQMDRIIKRNGAENAVQFAEKWIPLEEMYFDAYKIQTRCDMRF